MTGDTNPNAVKPFNWAALKLYELGPQNCFSTLFFCEFPLAVLGKLLCARLGGIKQ